VGQPAILPKSLIVFIEWFDRVRKRGRKSLKLECMKKQECLRQSFI